MAQPMGLTRQLQPPLRELGHSPAYMYMHMHMHSKV